MASIGSGGRVGTVASAVPRSVAELAATSRAWIVESGDFGRWVIAERLTHRDGQRWRIGLMPVSEAITAMVVWEGDVVVEHARGTEAEMCARAHHRVAAFD